MREWLLLSTAALSFYAVGQVWLVQLSSYPLFRHVGSREFHEYHIAWWHSIWGVILFPSSLVFLASLLMLWVRPPAVPSAAIWIGLGLQLALVAGTALWWGPLMARLSAPDQGLALPLYRTLMATHWLRVAIVTSYGILILWMLAESGRFGPVSPS